MTNVVCGGQESAVQLCSLSPLSPGEVSRLEENLWNYSEICEEQFQRLSLIISCT